MTSPDLGGRERSDGAASGRVRPRQGRLRHVRGRHAKDGYAGLPKLSELVIEHDDGRVLEATVLPTGPNVRRDTATGVCLIEPMHFSVCPICLVNPADTKEHVPPAALGGRVMTSTCASCNNTLGSRSEAAMQDWFDAAVRVHYTVDGDPRPFGHTRALVLRTQGGEVVVMPERGSDPGVEFDARLREGGRLNSHWRRPAPAEIRNGMLKSAYLAACLHLGHVPDVESAESIRRELQRVADAPRRSDVVAGPFAAGLRFYRTGAPPTVALALMHGHGPARDEGPEHLIALAGTVLVDWPFPEINPCAAALSRQGAHHAQEEL